MLIPSSIGYQFEHVSAALLLPISASPNCRWGRSHWFWFAVGVDGRTKSRGCWQMAYNGQYSPSFLVFCIVYLSELLLWSLKKIICVLDSSFPETNKIVTQNYAMLQCVWLVDSRLFCLHKDYPSKLAETYAWDNLESEEVFMQALLGSFQLFKITRILCCFQWPWTVLWLNCIYQINIWSKCIRLISANQLV